MYVCGIMNTERKVKTQQHLVPETILDIDLDYPGSVMNPTKNVYSEVDYLSILL